MQDKQSQLQPEAMYHIFNRANGAESLFLSDENYRFFLRQVSKYISPIADTLCYCLMPNHFHFLIRIKSQFEIELVIDKWPEKSSKTLQGFRTLEGLSKHEAISKFLTQQFSHLFNAYTQAFNKATERKGSLFMHPYKRKQISSHSYLIKLIHYIHYNPMMAGLAETCAEWTYSSFKAIISDQNSLVRKSDVIQLFDDLDNFKHVHKKQPDDSIEFLEI